MTATEKIYIVGADDGGWAISSDTAVFKNAVRNHVEFTNTLDEATMLYAATWYSLADIDKPILQQKKILAFITHDVRVALANPEFSEYAGFVDLWIAPSTRAQTYLEKLGLSNIYIPFGYLENEYKPLDKEQSMAKRQELGIAKDAYVIGSFQRDTEGTDLTTPKYVKGPDLWIEILDSLKRKNLHFHALLAGPRRFWILEQLEKREIPFTYVGERVNSGIDDIERNNLAFSSINELYNVCNAYITTSRMEGGPKAPLEATATDTHYISTDVGVVRDLVEPEQIFTNLVEAVKLIEKDIQGNYLAPFLEKNKQSLQRHLAKNTKGLYTKAVQQVSKKQKNKPSIILRERNIKRFLGLREPKQEISFYYETKNGPWGGANQFIKALAKEVDTRGWDVEFGAKKQNILFNSFHLDKENIPLGTRFKNVVHRIDGPTILIRDADSELDDELFEVNNRFADTTIFQSEWSFFKNLEQGYRPVNPILISNAADPEIFYPSEQSQVEGKIKIISTSWSDNPRKGGPIYKWLDQNLDFSKIEYTFVGRVQEEFENISLLDPMESEELAEELRKHHIFITASKNDPCSNSVVEALTTRLPVIFLQSGGHPELVQFGGLGFKEKEEIPELIQLIAEHYASFRNLVVPNNMKDIAEKYIEVFTN